MHGQQTLKKKKSVTKYHSTLRNIPDERRSHLQPEITHTPKIFESSSIPF